MKLPRVPHRWDLSPAAAIRVQQALATQVRVALLVRAPRFVAGLDMALSADGRDCLAAVVLWEVAAGRVVEQQLARRRLAFPYVPGLLSFREAPALLAALRKLRQRPDALMCDGQGLAHPRRFGLACHLGVLTGLPSVGCAKSRLVGTHESPGPRRGDRAPLRMGGEIVGAVLRTRDGVKPLFVSVGHGIDLEGAVRLVLACGGGFRLPEPTRLADREVARAKRAGKSVGAG